MKWKPESKLTCRTQDTQHESRLHRNNQVKTKDEGGGEAVLAGPTLAVLGL